MSKYESAAVALATRWGINVGDAEISMPASELRKLGNGRAYIGRGKVAGICHAGKILPRTSEATQMAILTVGAPQNDAERAVVERAMIDYLADHPGISGSAYDPAFAGEWASYRALMQELRA